MEKRSPFQLALALGLSALCVAQAADFDWPEWRNDKRDGITQEKGLLTSWPASGPSLVWKIDGLGEGYSGVAVSRGRIFTLGEKGASSFVVALDEKTGQRQWSVELGKAGAPGWGGFAGPRATPTVDGDRVFALGQYGALVCLDAKTGKELWRKNYMEDFGGPLPEWGFSESPLVDGDQLVCVPGGEQGTVIALNKKTGQLLWRTKDLKDKAAYSSLVRVEIDGQPQYLLLTEESLSGISPEGRVLWNTPRKGKVAVIPTPIYKDHHVFVTSGYQVGCNLFRITSKNGAFQAEEIYKHKDFDNHHGGVVLMGDHLYGHADRRGWVCQEFKTGKVVWSERRALRKGSIAAAQADGLLFLRDEDEGIVVLAKATPQGFQEMGRFQQPDRSDKKSWPHPVIANGRLYLRDQDRLFSYALK